MKSLYGYLIEPIGERYNNTKDVDGKELILNSFIHILISSIIMYGKHIQ